VVGVGASKLEDGTVLLESVRIPFFSAARKLLESGVSPDEMLEMQHKGSSIIALRQRIGSAAKLTVKERDKAGLVIEPYVPFPGPILVSPNGLCRSPVGHLGAASASAATLVPETRGSGCGTPIVARAAAQQTPPELATMMEEVEVRASPEEN
jgi:hypothetical protein